MNTYRLKFINSAGNTMIYDTVQESLQDAIRIGDSNPLFYLTEIYILDEDFEELYMVYQNLTKQRMGIVDHDIATVEQLHDYSLDNNLLDLNNPLLTRSRELTSRMYRFKKDESI